MSISKATDQPNPHHPKHLLLASLRSPIATLDELEELLLRVLVALDAVPRSFERRASKCNTELSGDDVLHLIPTIQHIVLNVILPAWLPVLRDAGHEQLPRGLFSPSPGQGPRHAPGLEMRSKVVMSAVSTLLSHLPTLDSKNPGPAAVLAFSVATLEDIVSSYPMDVIHDALFSTDVNGDPRTDARRMQEWEDFVRAACSVPGKVANALEGQKDILPSEQLDNGPYFSNMSLSAEKILFKTSQKPGRDMLLQSQSYLLLKLMRLGLFPASPPTLRSQSSFFSSTLPSIRQRLHLHGDSITSPDAGIPKYSETWAAVVKTLPLISQQTFLTSLLGELDCTVGRETSPSARRKVRHGASLLGGLLGTLSVCKADNEEVWSAVSAVVCGSGRTWDLGVLRAVVYWIGAPHGSSVNETALEKLLDATVAHWTNPESIRHSLLSQHRYTSSLFLLILASLPPTSSAFDKLALSPPLVASISTYLSHHDLEVRRCGMLIAEVVAKRSGKTLDFGGWEGSSEGLDWARSMREWQPDWKVEDLDSAWVAAHDEEDTSPLKTDPTPAHTGFSKPPLSPPDSDDESLQGYDSPNSSRTPSPTPSELAEIEQDPTLRVGRPKPVGRPVYLAQLVALLRTDKNDDQGAVERIEVALTCAEALIRRKKGFGMELEENAVELAITFAGLRDNYELAEFEDKRQGALNALVECCPHKAAITLVEQFFTNQYSTAQRFAILTALALGARALAGLPVPPARIAAESVAFPSKMLPPALHQRYGTVEEQAQAQGGRTEVRRLVQGITGPVMARSKAELEDATPQIVRERKLRVGRLGSTRPQVSEVESRVPKPRQAFETFGNVATEYFIMPLVNHMWLHMRDLETRPGGSKGHAGTGMILGSVVLAQYLGTLAVLVHAARHAPAFLGVVAPGVVELGLALGSRRVEVGDSGADGQDDAGDVSLKEGAVLTASLEVVLMALDACVDLDAGRTMGLEHTTLVLAAGEWAGGLLALVEGGNRVRGFGGAVEGRLKGAAAAVVVRIDGVITRWGRSMVSF